MQAAPDTGPGLKFTTPPNGVTNGICTRHGGWLKRGNSTTQFLQMLESAVKQSGESTTLKLIRCFLSAKASLQQIMVTSNQAIETFGYLQIRTVKNLQICIIQFLIFQ